MRVGFFGGTFNPPHQTHVQIAKCALKQLSLDKLIVAPCGIPPHKRTLSSAEDRLEMTKRAFSDIAEVSDYEIKKQGKSYTVETLRHLREQYPDAELFLIIGGDTFRSFGRWYRPEEIAEMATLAVAERANACTLHEKHTAMQIYRANTVFLDVEPNSVSSTVIRLRYQFGLPNDDVVPQCVGQYVKDKGLYVEFRPIVEKLKTYLDEKRMRHTFYVVKRGLEIADVSDNLRKVFLACLLHDCAKNIPESDYQKYGFVLPPDMPRPVAHSFLGACVARQDFGITEEDVLSAIAYHTTGCPNMTRLQKVVYVADKTEDTRPYPLDHLKEGTLDQQLVKCLIEANSYTKAHHGTADYSLTQQTLAYYCNGRR